MGGWGPLAWYEMGIALALCVCVCVCVCVRVCVCVLSRFQFFVAPWTVAHQPTLSMEFSMQEYWSRVSFPTSDDIPDPGAEPKSLGSPALRGRFFTTSTAWEVLADFQTHPALSCLRAFVIHHRISAPRTLHCLLPHFIWISAQMSALLEATLATLSKIACLSHHCHPLCIAFLCGSY